MLRNLGLLCALSASILFSTPARADQPEGPPVVGHGQSYDVTPVLPPAAAGETRTWTHAIEIPEATFLKAHFVDFDLQPGDRLVVRSASGRTIETLTGRGPKDAGNFWGLSGLGSSLHLELTARGAYGARAPFRIDEVLVGDVDLAGPPAGGGAPESICAPPDFEDAICYQSDAGKWANVLGSVGVMSVGGNPTVALFCSGSNVSPDNYVLTNDHCVTPAQCSGVEFVFQFYRTDCNVGAPPTTDWEGFRCDEAVANSPVGSCDQGLNDLDFTLASVIGDPASTYGWVTPDPVPLTDGEAIYIIQHPSGRPHEITHGSGPDVDVDGTVLRYYNTLDTEGGSSGSPIFREADDKLVGLHHCGGCSTPGVGNRGMLMSDIYPHIEPFLGDLGEIFSDGFESGDTSAWTCVGEQGCVPLTD